MFASGDVVRPLIEIERTRAKTGVAEKENPFLSGVKDRYSDGFLMNAIHNPAWRHDGQLSCSVALHRLFHGEGRVRDDPSATGIETGLRFHTLAQNDGGSVIDFFIKGGGLGDCRLGRGSKHSHRKE